MTMFKTVSFDSPPTASALNNYFAEGWECVSIVIVHTMLTSAYFKSTNRDELLDKIDGLESELASAVVVVFNSGNYDWVKRNYPATYNLLEDK